MIGLYALDNISSAATAEIFVSKPEFSSLLARYFRSSSHALDCYRGLPPVVHALPARNSTSPCTLPEPNSFTTGTKTDANASGRHKGQTKPAAKDHNYPQKINSASLFMSDFLMRGVYNARYTHGGR